MKPLAIIALIAIAVYLTTGSSNSGSTGLKHNEVIMYSLTTCGYCKAKVKELDEAGMQYVEYFIDKDPSKKAELSEKLRLAGFEAGGFGVPIFDVHGTMLINNPALIDIQRIVFGGD